MQRYLVCMFNIVEPLLPSVLLSRSRIKVKFLCSSHGRFSIPGNEIDIKIKTIRVMLCHVVSYHFLHKVKIRHKINMFGSFLCLHFQQQTNIVK